MNVTIAVFAPVSAGAAPLPGGVDGIAHVYVAPALVLAEPSTFATPPMYIVIDVALAVGPAGSASGVGVGVPEDPPEDDVFVDESGVPDEPPEDESSPPQPATYVMRGATDRATTANDRNFRMVAE